jgi:acyl carrier protein
MSTGAIEIHAAIQGFVDEIFLQKGLPQLQLSGETELLGGDLGLDSLDLAVIVTRLEELTGHDPFAAGFRSFSTVAELASLYASAPEGDATS